MFLDLGHFGIKMHYILLQGLHELHESPIKMQNPNMEETVAHRNYIFL